MLSPTPPSLRRDPVDVWEESPYDRDDDHQAVAVLEPMDEESEPAETKALLELLETDEAVEVAAAAMMDDLSLGRPGDVAVPESEQESLDSFEMAPGALVAHVPDGPNLDDDQPLLSMTSSADEQSPDDMVEDPIDSADAEPSFGGCLTIATDQTTDEDATDVLDRDVEEYSGIEGDDGYVFEDVDGEADHDVPGSDDDDASDDDEDDSNGSFGSNPFRR
jgi:hypothetical protein